MLYDKIDRERRQTQTVRRVRENNKIINRGLQTHARSQNFGDILNIILSLSTVRKISEKSIEYHT